MKSCEIRGLSAKQTRQYLCRAYREILASADRTTKSKTPTMRPTRSTWYRAVRTIAGELRKLRDFPNRRQLPLFR